MLTTPEFKVQSGIVLISGASTGIGRHAAEYLSERGYIVFAGVRKQSDYESIMDLKNPRFQALKFDVTDHNSCVKAIAHVSSVSDEWKIPFVALVNNAGVSRRQTAEFHELEDIRKVFDTNFFGMVDLTQLALPLLRESQGRVVQVSSVAGVFGAFCILLHVTIYFDHFFIILNLIVLNCNIGSPMSSVYSASKFAMEGWSDGLRREVRGFNVSVSIVQPAYVKSAIFDKTIKMNEQIMADDSVRSEITNMYPNLYSEQARLKRANGVAGADHPSVTSDAIYDAIHSKRPLTRYPVANFNGIPAHIIVHLLRIFPDYVIDAIFTRV